MKIASFLSGATLALGTLVLAACQQSPGDGAAATASASASASPDAKPGLSASGGILVLPPVKGRPGGAYFTLSNNGPEAVTLAAAHIEGADNTEMHETKDGKMNPITEIELAPGQAVTFERGGKHLMAFGLNDSLAVGGTAELTLIFSDGDKLSTPLKIESVTGAGSSDAMSGMSDGKQR